MRSLKVLIFFLLSSQAFAYVDLNLSYTYSLKRFAGEETEADPDPGEAVSTVEGYQIMWAWYMWEYTALEFTYGETNEKLEDTRGGATSDETISIISLDSVLHTRMNGIGIRQAFASRKARIIPALAIGYARYTTSGATTYKIDNNDTEKDIEIKREQESFHSYYGSFSVKFKITQLLGFTVAAKTILQDIDNDEPSDNVTYSAGLSWIF